MKNELDEIQPIDSYVSNLLRNAKERFNLDINVENPTRGQRLEAALAIKNEANGFYSMEIMVGRRVDSSEPMAQILGMLMISQAMFPKDPREFYKGFAHQYQGKLK